MQSVHEAFPAVVSRDACFGAHRLVWVASEHHMNVHFNPAGLLSVGDALSFVRELKKPQDASPSALGTVPLGVTS